MAVSILQFPQGPAYSYSEIVFVIGSDLIGPSILPDDLPIEHSFVIDIFIVGVTDRVGRYRKQGNTVGNSVIEIASVFNNELQYDLGILGATADTPGVNATKFFSVRFGEEYQNADGVLEVHTGAGGSDVGEPGVAANNVFTIKGFREFNLGDFTGTQVEFSNGPLSTVIGDRIHRDDTLTVSRLQSGPRVVVHYPLIIPSTGDTASVNADGTTHTFNIYDDRSFFGEVRFAWYNRDGGVDYFTFDQEGTTNTMVDKTDRNTSIVDYSGSSSSNKEDGVGNVFRGRSSTYKQAFETTHTKNSRWLTEDESVAVSGLFDSPLVYMQDGDNWLPTTVLNGAYPTQTTTRNTTNFQYQIEYRLRNDKRGY